MQVLELRVKNKHLAEEARIIKQEEQKLKKTTRANIEYHKEQGHNEEFSTWYDISYHTRCKLENHRKWDVRNEQRATFIARAYLEGKRCPEVYVKDYDKFTTYIMPRVLTMVNKYKYTVGIKEKIEASDITSWMTQSVIEYEKKHGKINAGRT